jgi:hypothetical protein
MRVFLVCALAQAGLRSPRPTLARAIELVATKSTGRPDECFEEAFKDVPYCRTWPNLPIGMPTYCKQPVMYTKENGTVTGPEECISFERPTNCDMHSYCHYCMVYKPEYGLLSAKDQGASYESCSTCVLEDCCSYYAAYGCEDQCKTEVDSYGSDAERICANNALQHLDSPLERMLTKKRAFKPAGYGEE